jgi:hypothetical protein
MAFTGNKVATSFKVELLKGLHNFSAAGGDTFKMALYDSNASFTEATTDYTATDEIVVAGYTAGGLALTNVEPTSGGTTAFTTFANPSWSGDLSAAGALVYNSTAGTNAIMVLDFGGIRYSVSSVFTVSMPTADQLNAILRL